TPHRGAPASEHRGPRFDEVDSPTANVLAERGERALIAAMAVTCAAIAFEIKGRPPSYEVIQNGASTLNALEGAEGAEASHGPCCHRSRIARIANLSASTGRLDHREQAREDDAAREVPLEARDEPRDRRDLRGGVPHRRHREVKWSRGAGGPSDARSNARSRSARDEDRSARCSDAQRGFVPDESAVGARAFHHRARAANHERQPRTPDRRTHDADQQRARVASDSRTLGAWSL